MQRSLILLLSFISSISYTQEQAPKFQVEVYLGNQHVHHHECSLEDKSYHRGFTMSSGVRLHFNLNKRLGIVTGYTLNNMVGNNLKFPLEHLLRLDIEYRFGFSPRFPRINMVAETGLEWAYYDKKLKFPVYFGSQYNVNPYMDWFCRLRLPNPIEVDELSLYQFIELSFEVGIALNPRWDNQPKFNATGNPFILQ